MESEENESDVKPESKLDSTTVSNSGSRDPKEMEALKKLVYEERRHFEILLKDRISIQLVFSTLLLYAVYRGVDPKLILKIPIIGDASLQRFVLILGSVVSLLLLQAVFRTYHFVKCALDEIKSKWGEDPYSRYLVKARFWNANRSLLGVSIALTFLIVILAFFGIQLQNFECG